MYGHPPVPGNVLSCIISFGINNIKHSARYLGQKECNGGICDFNASFMWRLL